MLEIEGAAVTGLDDRLKNLFEREPLLVVLSRAGITAAAATSLGFGKRPGEKMELEMFLV